VVDSETNGVADGGEQGGPDDVDLVARAAEAGYFAVPRETSLAAVAERADLSDVEASRRLRRGIERLVRDRRRN
jgi:predicted DNA binding protein